MKACHAAEMDRPGRWISHLNPACPFENTRINTCGHSRGGLTAPDAWTSSVQPSVTPHPRLQGSVQVDPSLTPTTPVMVRLAARQRVEGVDWPSGAPTHAGSYRSEGWGS